MKLQYVMQVFHQEDRVEFRVVDQHGEPWFVLADVCRKVGIANPSDAARRLDDDEKMYLDLTEDASGVRGGVRRMLVINESGLFSLILRSDKAEAKAFKKWVTAEVLPSIRKTGGYRGQTPAFIRRYQQNYNRVDTGYFSVLNELVIHLWGRFEHLGHILADRAPDGREIRPDGSVGRCFSDWLKKNHPTVSASFSYYMHKTPEAEVEARQYPFSLLPLFREYLDTVWIPERAEGYLKTRDPVALLHLPKLLPSATKPKAGMMRTPMRRAS